MGMVETFGLEMSKIKSPEYLMQAFDGQHQDDLNRVTSRALEKMQGTPLGRLKIGQLTDSQVLAILYTIAQIATREAIQELLQVNTESAQ